MIVGDLCMILINARRQAEKHKAHRSTDTSIIRGQKFVNNVKLYVSCGVLAKTVVVDIICMIRNKVEIE